MSKKLKASKAPKSEDEIVKEVELLTESMTPSNRSAQNEDDNWTNVDLITQQKNDNTLNELKLMGWIVWILMVLLCCLFVGFLGTWAWHFLIPAYWHWLCPDQIEKIESIIFSGTLGAMASIYFRGK